MPARVLPGFLRGRRKWRLLPVIIVLQFLAAGASAPVIKVVVKVAARP